MSRSAWLTERKTLSLESVHTFLAELAPDITVVETTASSATVELGVGSWGGAGSKMIGIRAGEQVMLLVASGRSRLDNRKFKDQFGAKPRMLGAEEVLSLTSHPVGGVCPFGLPSPLPVYFDLSLRRFNEVVPAAGATNAAVRISPERMAELVGGDWVDLCSSVVPIPAS